MARRPDVVDFARFRALHPDAADVGAPTPLVERSHLLAQYLADRQLAAVEGDGRAALALDLPIGSHVAGYETWAHGDLFAAGMTVGAPPDEFFADGQDWGFPPQLPFAGRRDGHSLWRRLVGPRRRARLGAAHRPRDGSAPALVGTGGHGRDRRGVCEIPT